MSCSRLCWGLAPEHDTPEQLPGSDQGGYWGNFTERLAHMCALNTLSPLSAHLSLALDLIDNPEESNNFPINFLSWFILLFSSGLHRQCEQLSSTSWLSQMQMSLSVLSAAQVSGSNLPWPRLRSQRWHPEDPFYDDHLGSDSWPRQERGHLYCVGFDQPNDSTFLLPQWTGEDNFIYLIIRMSLLCLPLIL